MRRSSKFGQPSFYRLNRYSFNAPLKLAAWVNVSICKYPNKCVSGHFAFESRSVSRKLAFICWPFSWLANGQPIDAAGFVFGQLLMVFPMINRFFELPLSLGVCLHFRASLRPSSVAISVAFGGLARQAAREQFFGASAPLSLECPTPELGPLQFSLFPLKPLSLPSHALGGIALYSIAPQDGPVSWSLAATAAGRYSLTTDGRSPLDCACCDFHHHKSIHHTSGRT